MIEFVDEIVTELSPVTVIVPTFTSEPRVTVAVAPSKVTLSKFENETESSPFFQSEFDIFHVPEEKSLSQTKSDAAPSVNVTEPSLLIVTVETLPRFEKSKLLSVSPETVPDPVTKVYVPDVPSSEYVMRSSVKIIVAVSEITTVPEFEIADENSIVHESVNVPPLSIVPEKVAKLERSSNKHKTTMSVPVEVNVPSPEIIALELVIVSVPEFVNVPVLTIDVPEYVIVPEFVNVAPETVVIVPRTDKIPVFFSSCPLFSCVMVVIVVVPEPASVAVGDQDELTVVNVSIVNVPLFVMIKLQVLFGFL